MAEVVTTAVRSAANLVHRTGLSSRSDALREAGGLGECLAEHVAQAGSHAWHGIRATARLRCRRQLPRSAFQADQERPAKVTQNALHAERSPGPDWSPGRPRGVECSSPAVRHALEAGCHCHGSALDICLGAGGQGKSRGWR